jgi:hypothetical protein
VEKIEDGKCIAVVMRAFFINKELLHIREAEGAPAKKI